MTVDTYADLFDDDLDLVASALSRARKDMILPVAESHRPAGTQRSITADNGRS